MLRRYWPPRMHSFAYGITVRQRPGGRGLPRGLAPSHATWRKTSADGETVSSKGDDVELTVVMPCLNEAETVATCVRKAVGFLREHDISGEVVIADNGSTDGSQQLATDAG